MAENQTFHIELVWDIKPDSSHKKKGCRCCESQIEAIKGLAEPLLRSAAASNVYRTFGELWIDKPLIDAKKILIPSLRYYTPHHR
jgi:hypothetical protein